MLLRKHCAVILMAGIVSGCTTELTHDVAGEKLSDEAAFEYYLPKQAYSITVTYTLEACPKDEDFLGFQVSQDVVITERNIVDASQHYYITYPDLRSALKTTNFTVANYPNQTIHTVGADVQDATADTAKNLVNTGISVAKMAFGVPPQTLKALGASLKACKGEVEEALTRIQSIKNELAQKQLTKKKREELSALLIAATSILQIKETGSLVPKGDDEASFRTVIAISDKELEQWFNVDYLKSLTPGKSFTEALSADSNRTHLGDYVSSEVVLSRNKDAVVPAQADLLTKSPHTGIVFRQPVPAQIVACAGSCKSTPPEVVGGAKTSIAQLAPLSFVSLENAAFKKNSISVTFAENGALSTLTYGDEAWLPKATGLLADTTNQANGLLQYKAAIDANKSVAKESAELNAVKAQTALINAQADLIEAKRRLAELQQGATSTPKSLPPE